MKKSTDKLEGKTFPREIRISLDENDFINLIAGEILEQRVSYGTRVRICLKDIGVNKMFQAVTDEAHKVL